MHARQTLVAASVGAGLHVMEEVGSRGQQQVGRGGHGAVRGQRGRGCKARGAWFAIVGFGLAWGFGERAMVMGGQYSWSGWVFAWVAVRNGDARMRLWALTCWRRHYEVV